MREALRSAFGYGLVAPTAGVPAETLEAATAAASSAAVAEGAKQLLEGGKSATSPTARYLDDLSPAGNSNSNSNSGGGGGGGGEGGGEGGERGEGGVSSSEAGEAASKKNKADGLWMGAEAAAYAAGAAAGVSTYCMYSLCFLGGWGWWMFGVIGGGDADSFFLFRRDLCWFLWSTDP